MDEVRHSLEASAQTTALLPIISTLSMLGLAAYLSITILYTADYHPIELDWSHYRMLLVLAVFSSLGTAGIPMSGAMVLPVFLHCFGLPLDIVPLVTLFEPLINGLRTTLNLTGAVFIDLLIDRHNGSLDIQKYMGKK